MFNLTGFSMARPETEKPLKTPLSYSIYIDSKSGGVFTIAKPA
jgi:hypothetical protein